VRYPLRDALELDLVPHCALIALRSQVTLRHLYRTTTSSLYYSGDTGTNRGTSLRRPWDARRRAQIRSDVLHQAAEDLVNEQAQVERSSYPPWFTSPRLALVLPSLILVALPTVLFPRPAPPLPQFPPLALPGPLAPPLLGPSPHPCLARPP
jgi:hypothetical protein